MPQAKVKEQIKVEASSGNVFADLSLPNPEEHLVKATIALAISQAIEKRGLLRNRPVKFSGSHIRKYQI